MLDKQMMWLQQQQHTYYINRIQISQEKHCIGCDNLKN